MNFLKNKKTKMRIGNWNINIWKSHGFSFLFHYQGKWNSGAEKRIKVWDYYIRI